MAFKIFLLASALASVSLAQRFRSNDAFNLDFTLNERAETTTEPVPILRFLDKQNPDGSYTYGYESGDGTYKLETRYATGEVKGKYGYIDSNGDLREVEYGATPEQGFQPRAEGLVLPPPILDSDYSYDEDEDITPVSEAPLAKSAPATPRQFTNFAAKDDEDRSRRIVIRKKKPSGDRRTRLPIRGTATPARRVQPAPRPAQPAARPVAPRPVAPRPSFAVPQQPAAFASAAFDGHPARNINLQTGSFTVTYG